MRNKRRMIKNTSIIMGLSALIVTVPTVSIVLTASKNEDKTNNKTNYFDPNKLNNYENSGTQNNETKNYDDIINNLDKATISNPIFAFDEKNNLVVPNINEEIKNELKISDTQITNVLKNNNAVINVPNSDVLSNFDSEKFINDSKNTSKNSIISKYSEEELNRIIKINDNQKKWLNHLIPNNNINTSSEISLGEFIDVLVDDAYEQAKQGNIKSSDAINSLSAFGINIQEEIKKLDSNNSEYLEPNSGLQGNGGHIDNNLQGGGGQNNNQQKPINPDVVIPGQGGSGETEDISETSIKIFDSYVESMIVLTSLSIAVSAAQIVINMVLFALSFWTNWFLVADCVITASSIVLASISLNEYVTYRMVTELPTILDYLEGWAYDEIAKTSFKKLFSKYAPIANTEKFKIYQLKLKKETQKIMTTKFIDKIKYSRYLKLSIVSKVLDLVNLAIDALIVFMDDFFLLIKPELTE